MNDIKFNLLVKPLLSLPLPTRTDSYKIGGHWEMLPEDVETTISYLEARPGAKYDKTVFFGLRYFLCQYMTTPITMADLDEAEDLCLHHLGSKEAFNRKGWEHVVKDCGGFLPLKIKAVPEGTVVPVNNVLMTVENTTGRKSACLTNYMETLVSRIWYPTTVCTLSYSVKQTIKGYLEGTSDFGLAGLPFMLHDFGARAVMPEQAGVGGMAHLVNFLGTDTVEALCYIKHFYTGNYEGIGYSVPATEHRNMTALGEDGEETILHNLLDRFGSGILSVVSDSYDIERFVDRYVRNAKDKILARTPNEQGLCKFVVRPDSLRFKGDTPAEQMVWLTEVLDDIFGHSVNSKGYRVLHPKVGLLWGDGIDHDGIESILFAVRSAGWSVDHLVFGMGGGLLQRVNRDTQRFAFKCCAQVRNGVLEDIRKNPLDTTKKSKAGRLKLVNQHEVDSGGRVIGSEYVTINQHHPLYNDMKDELLTYFKNGEILRGDTFEEIRRRAS